MNKKEDNNPGARWMLMLHLALLIYSCCSIFSKSAAKQPFLSMPFFAFYAGMIVVLGIYALLWQQVIKHMPITTAYANKAVTIVWGIILGRLFFNERITVRQGIAAVIIIAGAVLYVLADSEKKGEEQ